MKKVDYFQKAGIKIPRLNQIGILVPDIPAAAVHYSKLLGIGPWFRSKTIRHDVTFRDQPIRLDLDIVMAFRGGMEYELIQVLDGDDCIYTDLIRKTGGGIHHLGVVVRGFDEKLAGIQQAGIRVIQSGAIRTKGGAVTQYAYLDTVAQCGIITELIETKLMGVHAPQNRLMMQMGRLTGDVEMVKIV